MKITGYQIIDKQTGYQVGKDYSYAQRKRARAKAVRLDNEYGAYRYIVKALFDYSITDLGSKGYIDTSQVLFTACLGFVVVICLVIAVIF